MSSSTTSSKPTPGPASSVRLTLPSAAMKRLTEASIRSIPDVSLEYQRTANRYVLRGRESGGAVNELGRYVGFCGAEGEPLEWFLKPDSLTVNSDHAIVLAPAIASIEMFRYEHTYELLITRYRIVEGGEGNRPKAASELSSGDGKGNYRWIWLRKTKHWREASRRSFSIARVNRVKCPPGS